MAQVVESLSAGCGEDRGRFGPMIETGYGVMTWLRGEFAIARSHLERATAARPRQTIPTPMRCGSYPMTRSRRRASTLPWWTSCAAISLARRPSRRTPHTGLNSWASRRVPIASFSRSGRRAGCGWKPVNSTARQSRPPPLSISPSSTASTALASWGPGCAAAKALAALGADNLDPSALAAAIQPIATFVDASRLFGQNAYTTFFDALVARLLLAAGQPEQARDRLNIGLQLADDTGMHFYDAELLRLRARAQTEPAPAARISTRPFDSPAARAPPCSNCVPPLMILS